MDKLVTIAQAAALLHMHPASVKKAIGQGRIAVIRLSARVVLIERAEVERYRDAPRHAGGRPKEGHWPRTPTERRAARAQIVALILAEGLSPEDAYARNAAQGWPVSAPDGTIVAHRWARNERAVVSAMVAQSPLAGDAWRAGGRR